MVCLETYNTLNKWDKEKSLYHSFGEDCSFFGFLTYNEAKERKDVLDRLFSKNAVTGIQCLMLEKVYFPAVSCFPYLFS